jgi:limonene-1,2-epoxide hydrolase
MSAERNRATLIRLFENLGPGLDVFLDSYREALTDDCTWYMQGWPHVIGIEELEHQLYVLNALLGVIANPILEWRDIDAHEDRVYFERKGSFADRDGKTIATWDIFGAFHFNEDGKIYRIRDYFDSTSVYKKLKGVIPEEQITMINQLATHPLAPEYQPDPTFYRRMREQLAGVAA